MRIESVSVSVIRLPFKQPFTIAYESYSDMPSVIVKVVTERGIFGFGEAVPDQHVTGETLESTYTNLVHYLAPIILGEDPFNIEKIHHKMDEVLFGMPSAKAAIDIACYDLMGKMANQPVYNLIGGRYHPLLSIPHVIGIDAPDAMAKEAIEAVEQGFDQLKVKVGTDAELDILRVRSIRDAVGPKIRLCIDANQGWRTSSLSIAVLKELEDCKLDWVEQPVIAKDLTALAEVRKMSKVPVMSDEGIHTDKELREIINLQAADFINIKLMKCGGIYPALKLVNQAEMAGIECIVGSMIESSIATAAGAHLSIAKKNIIANEMAGPLIFSKDISPLDYDANQLNINNHPGLGLTVNEKVVDELLVATETIGG